jgi:hypothetical protein
MPQILIAHPAASPRWKTDTIVDVYPDTDDMHSFPEPLYTVIKAKGAIEEIRAKFQAQAGKVFDISSGKSCDNMYVKNLSASALTAADKTTLENTKSTTIQKDAVFTKLVKIDSIPVEDIKAEEAPKEVDPIVNEILGGGK